MSNSPIKELPSPPATILLQESIMLLSKSMELLSILLTGAVSIHLFEDLPFIDSLYLMNTSLSTIGFGDIVPKTRYGKSIVALDCILAMGICSDIVTNIHSSGSGTFKSIFVNYCLVIGIS